MAELALIVKRKLLFNGRLEVCSNGEIYRIKNGERISAAINGVSRDGKYQTTTISIDGKQKRLYVHRLVAEAFIPNPENKPHTNHKDGNPRNNDVCNIEWCTPSENTRHAYKNGLMNPMLNGKPCKRCGKLTRGKGGICTRCKIEINRERNRQAYLNVRKNELAGADINYMTERQRQICELRCKGLRVRQIAAETGITYQRVAQIILSLKKRHPDNLDKAVEAARDNGKKYPVLAAILKQRNVRQFIVAEVMGISNAAFTNKISGKSSWLLDEAFVIKEFLDVDMPIEELFCLNHAKEEGGQAWPN